VTQADVVIVALVALWLFPLGSRACAAATATPPMIIAGVVRAV
jgi:hypothetical protein